MLSANICNILVDFWTVSFVIITASSTVLEKCVVVLACYAFSWEFGQVMETYMKSLRAPNAFWGHICFSGVSPSESALS